MKWVLDRVDGFPKNQRFVLGTRLADAVLEVMEVLAEATYARSPAKAQLLAKANRRIESVRWLAEAGGGEGEFTMKSMKDMKGRRREHRRIGEMVGGWLKQGAGKENSP